MLFHNVAQKILKSRNPLYISDENKKANEGSKQRIVNFGKDRAVEEKEKSKHQHQ